MRLIQEYVLQSIRQLTSERDAEATARSTGEAQIARLRGDLEDYRSGKHVAPSYLKDHVIADLAEDLAKAESTVYQQAAEIRALKVSLGADAGGSGRLTRGWQALEALEDTGLPPCQAEPVPEPEPAPES